MRACVNQVSAQGAYTDLGTLGLNDLDSHGRVELSKNLETEDN